MTLDPAMHTSDIGISDVIASLRHVEGLSLLTGKAALAADVVNNDGTEVADTLQNQNSIELILNGDVDLSTELTPAFYDL